jgi:hypothetical protein
MASDPSPTHCFICQDRVKRWKAPYVDLELEGRTVRVHFTCWQRARSPFVTEGASRIQLSQPRGEKEGSTR